MKAGRELDALIAEKVMGWKLFRVGYCGTDDETPEQGKYEKALDRAGFDSVGWYAWTGGKVVLWEDGFTREHCFSTNIADAWEVVERLASSEKWLDIEYIAGEWAVSIGWNTAKTWFTTDGEKMDGLEEHNMEDRADTAPLAICLAALKAVQS